MRISDWSSDVCSSDLGIDRAKEAGGELGAGLGDQRDPVARPDARRDQPVRHADRIGAQFAERIGAPQRAPRIVEIESAPAARGIRSEEHTSELQSLMRISYAVFCLKKQKQSKYTST